MQYRYPNVMLTIQKLQKGASGARLDDTKSLKGPILEWIIPRGQTLNPPLARNVKMDRGFHHERTGSLLCPAGMDWSDPEYVSIYLLGPFAVHSAESDIRIKEKLCNGEIIIPGDQWPVFLYSGYEYDPDDPWKGLFRSSILVAVSQSEFPFNYH